MSLETCTTCNLPFVQSTVRSRQCLVCWKNERGYELTKSDNAHVLMSRATKKILDENEKLKAQLQELQKAAPKTQTLDQDFLRVLISLCHPDRHSNSASATEATKKLLAMRTKK
jgi:hypothetical protein